MANQRQRRGIGTALIGMIRLMRPHNGAIAFLSIASMGLIANAPARRIEDLLLAAAAGFFMTGFGNASNDYVDVEIDRINRPARPLPSGQVSEQQAIAVLVTSLLLSAGLAFILGPVEFLFVTVTAALLSGYNVFIKRIPLAGNATVALLTGAAFIFGGIAIESADAALYPALFAFLINLLRELLKDAEDVQGDTVEAIETYPRRYGMQATKKLAAAIALVLAVITFLPYATGAYTLKYAIVAGAGVDIPLIAGMVYLWKFFSRQRIAKISILLKYLMLLGLIAIILGTTTYL